MKKLFFVAIAAVALVFTACNEKKEAPVVQEEPVAEEETVYTVDSLSALINAENPDTAAISSFMTGVQSQIESLKSIDPTKAQEYLTQVQQFLKDNADKIKAVVGTGAIATAIDKVSNFKAEDLLNAATDAATDKAEGVVGDAKDKAEDLAGDAKAKVEDAAADAKAKVEDAAADAKAKVEDAAADAKAKANDAVKDAKAEAGKAVDKAAGDAKKALGL